MMAYKIYIVEDEQSVLMLLKENLEKIGYEVITVKDFTKVNQEFEDSQADLVIIDIKLPYFNGYYWCNEIRKLSNVPVIFLSSASDDINQIIAMDMGADDFIEKPFKMDILTAKIRAILRRTYSFSEDNGSDITVNSLSLRLDDMTVKFGEESIELSKNEFKILKVLMEDAGSVVSREKLMTKLWEDDMYIEENTLTVNINRLRKRLSSIGCQDFISTRVGSGYIVNK